MSPMKRLPKLLPAFLPALLFLAQCSAPDSALEYGEEYPGASSNYAVQDGRWYKGNLHTHSYWSGDAFDYPEMILKWYRDRGYNFVSLSEHDVMAEGDRWIEFPRGSDSLEVFREYRETFGEEWVTYEESENRLRVRLKTFGEYKPKMDRPGEFLVLKGEEISDGNFERPIHVSGINLREVIPPQDGFSDVDMLQNNIDAVRAQSERSGEAMLPVINHPHNEFTLTLNDLKQLRGARFMEVVNAHPTNWAYAHSDDASPPEQPGGLWDRINTVNRTADKGLIYGLGTDDAHEYHTFSSEKGNPGRAWITVWSEKLTPASIVKSMRYGKFYASTGVRLLKVMVNESGISLRIATKQGVGYRTQFIGTLKGEAGQPGQVLAEVGGANPSYTFSGEELFVRARVISDKPMEAYRERGHTEEALTQPVLPGKEVHTMGE